MIAPTIDARAAWQGDSSECRRLYRQFSECFGGSFARIRAHYRWTRPAMVTALRAGRQ